MPERIDDNLTLARYYDGSGYVFFCARDTAIHGKKDKKYGMYEHRLLMYAWGYLDSPFFTEDMREIHHLPIGEMACKDLNIESKLDALTPEKHREIDENRARLITPWDRQAVASD